MTTFALSLVIASALLHAIWNFLAKRVGGDSTFTWLFSTLATLIYLPLTVGLIITQHPPLTASVLGVIGGTCVLHLLYYSLLSRGYRFGDLSLVYPLARGTGPVLASLGAVLLFEERPSLILLAGTLLVSIGILIMTGNPLALRSQGTSAAVMYALLTGLAIAAYTLWDKYAVSKILIAPLLLTWTSSLVRTVFLAPQAWRNWAKVRSLWRIHWRSAVGIGILDPLSYILFLWALSFSPVSYLAPIRLMSILFGTFLGSRLLAEGATRRRMAAASVMLIGLIAIALG